MIIALVLVVCFVLPTVVWLVGGWWSNRVLSKRVITNTTSQHDFRESLGEKGIIR